MFVVLWIDAFLIALSYYFANLIRFEFSIPWFFLQQIQQMIVFIVLIKIVIFHLFNLYRGMWRYTSVPDLINIIKASIISSLLIVSLVSFVYRFEGFSRSVFIIDWFFSIFFIAGFRLSVRFYYERISGNPALQNIFGDLRGFIFPLEKDRKRLLIIGAGDCGETIYREIRGNDRLGYSVTGFLDDDPMKQGKTIHGVPVLGAICDIQEAAQKTRADEALIAIPSARGEQMRRIVEHCRQGGVEFKTIPGYSELINGKVSVKAIRDVSYSDLLGREAIRLDQKKIGAYLKSQTVLVTGAGGSIGSELCRQAARFQPARLLLLDNAESPLYEIELELKTSFAHIHVVPLLCDVQEYVALEKVFTTFRPQTVFHAAAYKHVPMLELQPWKAVDNNIIGTLNMIEISSRFDIDRFVFVSTDKAVRPANVMGASKRVAEMLVQSRKTEGECRTRFMIVRFGNVVGSVGSVIPLFKKQIERGGPVTVTHPEVTRYFMMIPEACQLILQAGAMADEHCGEIYLLEMGTPIKIADMARDLIRFSGFIPEEEIKIQYIGLRPGEKLYEELITADEGVVATSHEKIMVLKSGHIRESSELIASIADLAAIAKHQNRSEIIEKLMAIVPEYRPGSDHGDPGSIP